MPSKQNLSNKQAKKQQLNFNIDDLIFALDIGTRTVVGIVGYYEKENFRVIAAEVIEHQSRAMLDGQIHDINKVAEVITQLKNKLETILGFPLTQVAIAAAGRVLRTSQYKLEYEVDQESEISSELVGSLEVDAVQKAQEKLENEIDLNKEKISFYCVGYSVVNYYLNGYVIASLVGHKGKKIGVDVLATFLPHVVVDSLYTVMARVGLEVISLTLEPIAAINVTIPRDLRLLNLVLVDIGAGTSDIALTKDGSVVAYGMVPIAGDEITEKIAHEFLVDFNSAEKIKISISSGVENIKFTDILGKKNELSNENALKILEPTIDFLAKNITDKIMEFNQKAPNAVFLIGGGSQIPGLSDKIASGLGMSSERVAVRGRDVIQNIKTKIKKLSGPESITPFGIAMTAHSNRGQQDFMTVTLNGEKVQLFNAKKLNVADALILIGYNPDMLIGRTGKPLKFIVNGKQIEVKGEHGTSAEIIVNDTLASLDTIIHVGDSIKLNPAQNGKDACRYINNYIKNPKGITVSINGSLAEILPVTSRNGELCSISDRINNGDNIIIEETTTLGNFAYKYELDLDNNDLLVNGINEDLDYILQNDDEIIYRRIEIKNENSINTIDEAYKLEDNSISWENNGYYVTVNDQKIMLDENKNYIFVDIFSYINFDLSAPNGSIVLKLNGAPANFTDSIKNGDSIEIYWDKSKG